MRNLVNRVSTKLNKLTSEQVEQLLEGISEKNEMLTSIFDSLPVGLLICDENWQTLYKNKSLERYIQMRDGDKFVWETIDDTEIASFLQNMAETNKTNTSRDFSVETPSGKSIIASITTMPLVYKYKLKGTIIRVEDITEKRKQDILLRRIENMSRLTELAASVAHEIKNPLGAMSIHLQLAQKAVKMEKPDQVEKHLDIASEEIERLNKIVVDFLFATKPVKAELSPLKLQPFLADFIKFIRPECDEKNIVINSEISENIPIIMVDEKLLKQVLINLTQNAIFAMENREVGQLGISAQEKEGKVFISIADNGCGMSDEVQSRIFEPYYTTKTQGTGLGLTTVYKITREFGGDIQVKSVVGSGSIFVVSLPSVQHATHTLEYHEGK